jgi:predicted DsbA family dithiol-disulfide isomerase
MNERSISEDRIYKIAEKVGLNITQLENDMNNPDVDLYLADTLSLATRIPSLSGTPFFIIGDNLIPGADEERLDSVLQDVLSKS